MGCALSVKEDTAVIIETYGKFTDIKREGFVCVVPCLQNVAGVVSLKEQQLTTKCEVETSDNVFVTVEVTVDYQVDSARIDRAFYWLKDPQKQIEMYVLDVIGGKVREISMNDLHAMKQQISHSAKCLVEEHMSTYGFDIVRIRIIDINAATISTQEKSTKTNIQVQED